MDKEELLKEQYIKILNEQYQKAQFFPITESSKYENYIAFCKGMGWKILRNSKGQHKLI